MGLANYLRQPATTTLHEFFRIFFREKARNPAAKKVITTPFSRPKKMGATR